MATTSRLSASFYFESTGQKIGNKNNKVATFTRSDTIPITGKVTGLDISGLTAAATFSRVNRDIPNGLEPLTTKSSGDVPATIVITELNANVAEVRLMVEPAETSTLEDGDSVVFDVEVIAPNTPGGSMKLTTKGTFTVEQDYTLG